MDRKTAPGTYVRRITGVLAGLLIFSCAACDPAGHEPGVKFDVAGRVVVFVPDCGQSLTEVVVQDYVTPDELWRAQSPRTDAARAGRVVLGDASQFLRVEKQLSGPLPQMFNVSFFYGALSQGSSLGIGSLPKSDPAADRYWQATDVGGPYTTRTEAELRAQFCTGATN